MAVEVDGNLMVKESTLRNIVPEPEDDYEAAKGNGFADELIVAQKTRESMDRIPVSGTNT